MLEISGQFLSSEHPCEQKNLEVVLSIGGVEKYARKTCGCIGKLVVSIGGHLS